MRAPACGQRHCDRHSPRRNRRAVCPSHGDPARRADTPSCTILPRPAAFEDPPHGQAGWRPVLPGCLDSRFRGNDGVEVAGTTQVGGTRRSREHRPGASGIRRPHPAEPEPGARSRTAWTDQRCGSEGSGSARRNQGLVHEPLRPISDADRKAEDLLAGTRGSFMNRFDLPHETPGRAPEE